MSEVIQRVSGKSFPDFIQKEIFEKIGMNNSRVFSTENEHKIPNRAFGYNEWPYLTENDFSPCNYNFGDGGIYTNLNDYQKWISFLEKPDVLLGSVYSKKIFEAGLTNSGESTSYAYGWAVDEYKGNKMLVHNGAWIGFQSFIANIPEKRLWVVILSNYRGISINRLAMSFFDQF